MTIDEKLQHFYEVSIDEAKEDAAQAIQAHKENLSQMLEEHKQSQRQTADAQIKAEAEHVRREVNKALSAEQITLKRNWSQKQEEMKQKLFAEVKALADKFMQTPEYDDYLCRKITEASAFAEGDEIHIFLSAADKDRLESLKEKTGVSLTVSEEAFTGGIRAEIPGKNILIDASFSTGLENMCKEFKFDGGSNHE